MKAVALDTSVLMPSVHSGLPDHVLCREQLTRATAVVQGVWIEAFAALTRLPHGYALNSDQALRALRSNCPTPMVSLEGKEFVSACQEIAAARLVGGQVYDGLIAVCARAHNLTLVSRDRRAIPTYAALGVSFELIAA